MRSDPWQEDDQPERVMISALEHYAYCPRQCGLIHIEQIFDENVFTLRGRLAHDRVDQETLRHEHAIRVERAMPLWSRRLGLIGRADVVEFHGDTPYPVEYKVGRRREWTYEAIQVCAQGMCLEEMFATPVTGGAIYYCGSRTRREIPFDAELRHTVEKMTAAVRQMLETTKLPAAVNDQRCAQCSLLDSCLPAVTVRPRRLQVYRAALFDTKSDP